MMEERDRVEKNLNDVLDLIDARFLRKMQTDMFKCAAKCFEKPSSSRMRDQECYEQCAAEVKRASSVVEHCMEEYQGTIRHCLDSCADSVRYRSDLKPGEALPPQIQQLLSCCTSRCVNNFIANKESVLTQIDSILKSFSK